MIIYPNIPHSRKRTDSTNRRTKNAEFFHSFMRKGNLASLDIQIIPFSAKSQKEMQETPYMQGPIKILDGLYLGCQDTAQNSHLLVQLGIEAIINVAKECSCESPTKYTIQLDWSHDEDISKTIDRAIEIISQFQCKKVPVLVHCLQGISRSAALVIGYIMKSKGYSCAKAYEFVKKRAPQISPNVSLISHLYQCEKQWS